MLLNRIPVLLPALRPPAEIAATPVHRRDTVDGKRSSQSWNLAELVKDQECAVRKADGRRLSIREPFRHRPTPAADDDESLMTSHGPVFDGARGEDRLVLNTSILSRDPEADRSDLAVAHKGETYLEE